MKCSRCHRPEQPRVFKDLETDTVVDESGMGGSGRPALPDECNRRSATGRVRCMEKEIELKGASNKTTLNDFKEYINFAIKRDERQEAEIAALKKELSFPLASLTGRIEAWVRKTLGNQLFDNQHERMARLLEEVFELAQTVNFPASTAIAIMNRAYSRPVGFTNQETAGVGVCLIAWAKSQKFDLLQLIEAEVNRVENSDPIVVRKKQTDKFIANTGLQPDPSL